MAHLPVGRRPDYRAHGPLGKTPLAYAGRVPAAPRPVPVVRAVAWDDPDAVALRAAQRVEIAERYGRPDSEPGPAPTGADIAWFAVARVDGVPAGCGGLRQLDGRTGEIKRMYVAPAFRGTGVATAVLAALESQARERSWTALRLETGNAQPDAVRFYTREGYTPIPRFGHYAGQPPRCASSACWTDLSSRPVAPPGARRPGAGVAGGRRP